MVEKLVPDPFLTNQNWVYLWINSKFVLILCPSQEILRNIETFLLFHYLACLSKQRYYTLFPGCVTGKDFTLFLKLG